MNQGSITTTRCGWRNWLRTNPPLGIDTTAPAETTPQAGSPTGTPGAAHDPTVTDAAVAAAAGAADAWNATASAAAKSGAAIGRSSQKRAVATAGAFTRWGRRVASSF